MPKLPWQKYVINTVDSERKTKSLRAAQAPTVSAYTSLHLSLGTYIHPVIHPSLCICLSSHSSLHSSILVSVHPVIHPSIHPYTSSQSHFQAASQSPRSQSPYTREQCGRDPISSSDRISGSRRGVREPPPPTPLPKNPSSVSSTLLPSACFYSFIPFFYHFYSPLLT